MASPTASYTVRRALVGVASLLMVGAAAAPGSSANVVAAAVEPAPAVPRNYALGAKTQQSSTGEKSSSALIVDGYDKAVSSTARQINPWWEADLGASRYLTELKIWKLASDRDDFWVFLSAKPFTSDDPKVVAADPNVTAMHFTEAPDPLSIPVQSVARYVRVQGKGVLSMAEVAAYGPVGIENFAPFGTATQSSTSHGGSPERAIDGASVGAYASHSVSHTAAENQPWWQVDLGVHRQLSEIRVWNRTGCCAGRLSDFYVFASDEPFASNDPVATAQDPNVTTTRITDQPNPMVSIPLERTARYVRVQLAGSTYLTLAEVEVLGPEPRNYAPAGAATQSSMSYAGVAEYAQDNNRDGNFFERSVSHTGREAQPWWQVDLGASPELNEIRVWNRTDCCGDRLSDFYVFASDQPFSSSDPGVLAQDPNVTTARITDPPNPVASIPLDRTARYVRVQLADTDYLSLAEVEVLGPDTLQRPDTQTWIDEHRFGMFIHYGMGTATDEQWAKPNTPARTFKPGGDVDTDAWVETMQLAGMDYAVLTAKHHDGFALWPTRYSDYSVASSEYQDGDGDIVRDYVDSVRAGGLKPGIYFSIWDRTNRESVALIKNQLRELLTNYGEIDYLWLDGYGRRIKFTKVPWNDLRDFVHQVSPNTIVAANDHRKDPTSSDILLDEFTASLWNPASRKSDLPLEVAQPIDGATWFYDSESQVTDPLSVEILTQNLETMESGNVNYLLNIGPRLDGTIDQRYVDRLREMAAIRPG